MNVATAVCIQTIFFPGASAFLLPGSMHVSVLCKEERGADFWIVFTLSL